MDPTCVFTVDLDLIGTLEATLGPPIDSYLNGWQVWIEPLETLGHSPEEDVQLEYRLHPPVGFTQPRGLSHHDLWDAVVEQVASGRDRFVLGEEERSLDEVWVLLEVYPAFGEDLMPDALRGAVERVLGRAALACGAVDHARLGNLWKRTKGAIDLPAALLEELGLGAR